MQIKQWILSQHSALIIQLQRFLNIVQIWTWTLWYFYKENVWHGRLSKHLGFFFHSHLANAKHSSTCYSLGYPRLHPCYGLNLAANESKYPTVPQAVAGHIKKVSWATVHELVGLIGTQDEKSESGSQIPGIAAEGRQLWPRPQPCVSDCTPAPYSHSQFTPLILKEASGVTHMSPRQMMIMMSSINRVWDQMSSL